MAKKMTTNQLLTRYALTGGAIGLYFGFFFRPAREPNLWFALLLAGLVVVVTVVVISVLGVGAMVRRVILGQNTQDTVGVGWWSAGGARARESGACDVRRIDVRDCMLG